MVPCVIDIQTEMLAYNVTAQSRGAGQCDSRITVVINSYIWMVFNRKSPPLKERLTCHEHDKRQIYVMSVGMSYIFLHLVMQLICFRS